MEKVNTYYLPETVALHHLEDDLWVIIKSKIYDVSPLIQKWRDTKYKLLLPIIKNGGQDISHWFQENSDNIKTFIDAENCQRLPVAPDGLFLGAPSNPGDPNKPICYEDECWWIDETYVIGHVSENPIEISVLNSLTKQRFNFRVCQEWTINEILNEFSQKFNSHSKSYVWKFKGNELDMDQTLEKNGIQIPFEQLIKLNVFLSGELKQKSIPTIILYYSNDLSAS